MLMNHLKIRKTDSMKCRFHVISTHTRSDRSVSSISEPKPVVIVVKAF